MIFLLGMTLNPTSKGGCEETIGNTKECGCLLGGKPGLYPILWVCPPQNEVLPIIIYFRNYFN
jgi:hypothetical protein